MLHRTVRSATILLCALSLPSLGACGATPYAIDAEAPLGLHPRQVRTLGCLDLGARLGADSRLPADSLLLMLRGGNRCEHPEPVDLLAMKITATDADGSPASLELVDPRHEIELRHLDASASFIENLPISGEVPAQRLVEVCLHFEGVASDAPHARPRPICFLRTEQGWSP